MSVVAATAVNTSTQDSNPTGRSMGTTTRVLVVLDPAVLARGDGSFPEAIRASVSTAIARLCVRLGIPGTVESEIQEGQPVQGVGLFKLTVNGDRVRFPPELLSWLCAFLDNGLPPFMEGQDWLNGWLERHDSNSLLSLISLGCVEGLKRKCSVLFGHSAATAYLERLQQAVPELSGIDPGYLQEVLKPALDAWVSIANVSSIGAVLADYRKCSAAEASQEVIASLSAGSIEIRMSLEYMREVTIDASKQSLEALSWLRQGLFDELGINFPPFHLTPDDSLGPRSFAFRINDVQTMSTAGLPPGTILVNTTPDDFKPLKESLLEWASEMSAETNSTGKLPADRVPMVHAPATDWPYSLLPASFSEQASALPITTWDPLQYVALCAGAVVRAHASRMITLHSVRSDLKQLAAGWAMTVATARTEVKEYQLTLILQQLAREGIPIGNVSTILERLIDREYLATRASAITALEDYPDELPNADEVQSPADLLRFVRAGMRRTISEKLARHTTTLVLYLLDAEMEKMLAKAGALENLQEQEVDLILEAVRAETQHLPPRAQVPSVVTTPAARYVLREVLLQEFPRMSVIAHNEVSPEYNIQPIARIRMPGP